MRTTYLKIARADGNDPTLVSSSGYKLPNLELTCNQETGDCYITSEGSFPAGKTYVTPNNSIAVAASKFTIDEETLQPDSIGFFHSMNDVKSTSGFDMVTIVIIVDETEEISFGEVRTLAVNRTAYEMKDSDKSDWNDYVDAQVLANPGVTFYTEDVTGKPIPPRAKPHHFI